MPVWLFWSYGELFWSYGEVATARALESCHSSECRQQTIVNGCPVDSGCFRTGPIDETFNGLVILGVNFDMSQEARASSAVSVFLSAV